MNVKEMIIKKKISHKILKYLDLNKNRISFFDFSVSILPFILLKNSHQFFIEICLDSSLVIPNEGNNPIYFSTKVKEEILKEIHNNLLRESENIINNSFKDEENLHIFCSFSYLLISLLEITDIGRIISKNKIPFYEIYSQILKKIRFSELNEKSIFLEFILPILTILYQYSCIYLTKNYPKSILFGNNLLNNSKNFETDWINISVESYKKNSSNIHDIYELDFSEMEENNSIKFEINDFLNFKSNFFCEEMGKYLFFFLK